MISVLHISYELRDRKTRKTTVAVKNLIDCTRDFSDPEIIDLIRVTNLKEEKICLDERGHLTINAAGFPFSLFLRSHLNRVYQFIRTAEDRKLIDFSNVEVIHAHKLTFEGYIAYKLHKKLNVPYMVTLRSTDFTVLKFRPDLRKLYKNILQSASKIFYLVPSMKSLLRQLVGAEFYEKLIERKMTHLPNIIEREPGDARYEVEEPYLLTVLSLTRKDTRRKNLHNLLKAITEIKHLDVRLKIIGSGEYEGKIRKWINILKLNDKVELLGSISNDRIDKYFASATAFALPSVSESFGLVYAESLFNGTPILCSRGVVGFDGFFNNTGVAVDPRSVEEISNGLVELITNNSFYRNEIQKLKKSGAFQVFSAGNISNIYRDAVNDILSAGKKRYLVHSA